MARSATLLPCVSRIGWHFRISLSKISYCLSYNCQPSVTSFGSGRLKMSEKALTIGSQCPPLEKDKLRLYGMRFCPYVKRVRLVLADKKLEFETVNINLTEKPEWFVKRFPEGKVPVLEQNGKTISESAVIADYLDDAYPEGKLHPTDPYQKAKDVLLLNKFSKVSDNWGRALYKPEDAMYAIRELGTGLDVFENELKSRNTPFFGGDSPKMLDFMIWPWFEMMMSGEYFLGRGYSYDDMMPPSRCLNLRAWVKKMLAHPSVQQTLNIENQHAYAKSIRVGVRNYDIGL